MERHFVTKHKTILVPFPFDDLSSTKVRPAVCLTNPFGPHRHVVVAFITSRVPDTLLSTDYLIEATAAGFAETGLRVTSVLRLHRLMTLSTTIIERELGRLSTTMVQEVESRLRILFGLK